MNEAKGVSSSIVAGSFNVAEGFRSSILGGSFNLASGSSASVSGGVANEALGVDSSILGGLTNTASGFVSTVSRGEGNTASGVTSGVSGGLRNTANGQWSSVSGGRPTLIIVHGGQTSLFSQCDRRRTIGAALKTSCLLDDYAALVGEARETVSPPLGRVRMSASEKATLAAVMTCFIEQTMAPRSDEDGFGVSVRDWDIVHMVALLSARSPMLQASEETPRESILDIVRRAEDCFTRSAENTPSLADLCRAAGFSAPTLTAAIRGIFDLTPQKYFAL